MGAMLCKKKQYDEEKSPECDPVFHRRVLLAACFALTTDQNESTLKRWTHNVMAAACQGSTTESISLTNRGRSTYRTIGIMLGHDSITSNSYIGLYS